MYKELIELNQNFDKYEDLIITFEVLMSLGNYDLSFFLYDDRISFYLHHNSLDVCSFVVNYYLYCSSVYDNDVKEFIKFENSNFENLMKYLIKKVKC